MNKEEQDIIVFLEISATTKAKKTIISKEDVKCLLNYIDKLQKENEVLKENNLSYQKELAKAWKENKEQEDKIRAKIKELEENEELYREQDRMYEFESKIKMLRELLGDDE